MKNALVTTPCTSCCRLPVPEEKDSDSMTQAEAFQGGFLRELDEDEKKRFTPSELLLYKHALEYR